MVRHSTSAARSLALAVALLLAIRGYNGTLWSGMFMVNRAGLLSNDVPSLLRKLLEIHQEETLHAQQASWASHIEGRHTGLNGRHPLQALRIKDVYGKLLDMVDVWEAHFERILSSSPGAFTEDVLLSMCDAVHKQFPLAERDGSPIFGGNYIAQNTAKCLASFIPQVFGLPHIKYSQVLHEWVCKK